LAYYFAFFGVAREYGTSAFCPLVIDGPNQQGQDAKHLPAMIKFICQKAPDDSQLILGVEDASDVLSLKSDDVEILDVSSADKRILIEGDYEVAAGIWRGFMTELVFGDSVGG